MPSDNESDDGSDVDNEIQLFNNIADYFRQNPDLNRKSVKLTVKAGNDVKLHYTIATRGSRQRITWENVDEYLKFTGYVYMDDPHNRDEVDHCLQDLWHELDGFPETSLLPLDYVRFFDDGDTILNIHFNEYDRQPSSVPNGELKELIQNMRQRLRTLPPSFSLYGYFVLRNDYSGQNDKVGRLHIGGHRDQPIDAGPIHDLWSPSNFTTGTNGHTNGSAVLSSATPSASIVEVS